MNNRHSVSGNSEPLFKSGKAKGASVYFWLGLLFILTFSANQSSAQSKGFEIQIVDNAGVYNNKVQYNVTKDSVQITGLADFGRTPVKYFTRKLTRKEGKSLSNFIKTFPIDSLDDQYKNEFNPVDYDNKAHYPRIMQISIRRNGQFHTFQTINCWVRYSDNLFSAINPLLPEEVKIKYDKSQFNAFY